MYTLLLRTDSVDKLTVFQVTFHKLLVLLFSLKTQKAFVLNIKSFQGQSYSCHETASSAQSTRGPDTAFEVLHFVHFFFEDYGVIAGFTGLCDTEACVKQGYQVEFYYFGYNSIHFNMKLLIIQSP